MSPSSAAAAVEECALLAESDRALCLILTPGSGAGAGGAEDVSPTPSSGTDLPGGMAADREGEDHLLATTTLKSSACGHTSSLGTWPMYHYTKRYPPPRERKRDFLVSPSSRTTIRIPMSKRVVSIPGRRLSLHTPRILPPVPCEPLSHSEHHI